MKRTSFIPAMLLCIGVLFLSPLQMQSASQPVEDPLPRPIPKGDIAIELELVANDLASPVTLVQPDDGTGRLLIVDQTGQVWIWLNGNVLEAPWLDLASRLVSLDTNYDERGLLGLALHPDFANNGLLYTYTSEPVNGTADFTVTLPDGESFNHQSVISQWKVSDQDPDQVDPNSRLEVMRIDQPQSNHNGGTIHFGSDGFLYIALGDGGAADDQGIGHSEEGNAQDTGNILGTILRIQPNNDPSEPYLVPGDNPFVDEPGVPDEVYAYGFRNPYIFTFDKLTGELYAADVGQNDVEEVDLVQKGGNYGWRIKEGSFFFDPNGSDSGFVTANAVGPVPDDLIDPIAEYDHDEGSAIVGGFVYRGSALPGFQGRYVNADWGSFSEPSGRLFYLDDQNQFTEFQIGSEDRSLGHWVKGFGQDLDGELYVMTTQALGPQGDSGKVFKIVPLQQGTLKITEASVDDGMVTLQWTNGTGPFVVQKKASLNAGMWMNVTATTETTATFAQMGEMAFYQILDLAESEPIPMTTSLSGAAERPNPVTTSASGAGSFTLSGDTLSFQIHYTDLSAPATAAHIHGPAPASAAAGVLINLAPFNGDGFGTSGTLAGSTTLTPEQKTAILNGQTYVNIHTSNNTGGEIRGQIAPVLFTSMLTGDAERPNPVDTAGHGAGTILLVEDQLTFSVVYSGLSGPASAAHIHGPASEEESAGVLVGLNDFNGTGFGTSGTLSGTVELDPNQLAAVVDGQTYINIHTAQHGGGEIRGQIKPRLSATPFSAALSGAAEQPDPVTTDATGLGAFWLEGDKLTFQISYEGLSGTASAAHIHGPALASEGAGVLINLAPFNGGSFGTSGSLAGTVTLTEDQEAAVRSGLTYVNIHTSQNPGGEIRGQIAPVHYSADLSGDAERPDPVTTGGQGRGDLFLVSDTLTMHVVYSNLSAAATAAHIHGPASTAESVGVLVGLGDLNGEGFGTSGVLFGSLNLAQDTLPHLIDGMTYINIHTSENPGGEIRGQIIP